MGDRGSPAGRNGTWPSAEMAEIPPEGLPAPGGRGKPGLRRAGSVCRGWRGLGESWRALFYSARLRLAARSALRAALAKQPIPEVDSGGAGNPYPRSVVGNTGMIGSDVLF